ncbi:protein TolR [Bartonella quintana]|uniref:TolR protein n=3 Tax=Bartonella quintana TaxID=803 RepID=A0A0H3LUZ1_BARQU|nr:protein TolR [Bartonella quintana]ETS12873.1 protein TolR [Bartonella quintana BQ2-D70]ETS14705.1 protein TolR [Bartonella quintana JK 73rel]ETS17138.1 protein TolR [Bartonella quintana JK 73]ETS17233.1 protein TolR [Bartonella quintana JK 12]ETS19431.1 protein TolR [Bartonella quintana JK 7]
MGVSVASSSQKNTRRRHRLHSQLMSEINVTPFVDVVLVLLIIFMVSAPLLINGVPLDLPRSQAEPVRMESTPITVSLDAQGRLAINQDYYDTFEALIAQLKTQHTTDLTQKNQRIFVRAARTIEYQKVLQLLAELRKAGFSQISLASLAQ